MINWPQKPTTIESTLTVNGVPHYRVGRYTVAINREHENLSVSYWASDRQSRTDPRSVLPNMAIDDGVLRIDLEDLVELIVQRAEPAELARALWTDEGVREAFLEALVQSWNNDHVTDSDRRKLLARVKETVYEETVRETLDVLSSAEFETVRQTELHHWAESLGRHSFFSGAALELATIVREHERTDALGQAIPPDAEVVKKAALDLHAMLEKLRSDGEVLAEKTRPRWMGTELTRIGGSAWNESRDYWRRLIEERFPVPREETS